MRLQRHLQAPYSRLPTPLKAACFLANQTSIWSPRLTPALSLSAQCEARIDTPTQQDAETVSALSPLRFSIFRDVWVASIFSNLGSLIQSVGAAWTMISLHASADLVALVQTSVTLPIMLLSLVAGAMADNLDRRKILISAQVFMFVVSAILALCAWRDALTAWLLLTFTFLIGCGGAFLAPAWQAAVGDMVPRAHLPGAVALNSMGYNIARSVGPAIGGVIVSTLGVAAAFCLNAVSYLGLVAVLARWRPATAAPVLPREGLLSAVAAGVRYVNMSPALVTVLIRGAVFGLSGSVILALMPLVAKELLGGGALTYGLLLGAFGVGAVLGAITSIEVRRRISAEAIFCSSTVVFAISTALVAISPVLVLTMLALLVAGAAWLLALSTLNVTVQLSAPRWVVARALSLYQMTAFGGLAAGSWIWGLVAEQDGLRTSLSIAAALTLAGALLGRWLPLARAEQLNLDPLNRWREPVTAVPVDSRTGPVVVTIEYRIREADILEFLTIMNERRRVRRRDGARNWRLLRDLANPEVWIERYSTPTWLDYVRHNNRATHEDARVWDQLRALHKGTEPPAVRRLIERQISTLHSQPAPHPPHTTELATRLSDPTP